jgi:hypothetical protein
MKNLRTYFVGLLFCLVSISLFSQTLSFCKNVDQNTGSLIGENSSFTFKEDSGSIILYVKLPYDVLCSVIFYDIYSFNESTQQDQFEATITQDVEENWTYFYKAVMFYKSAKYKIRVFDCLDEELVTNVVIIKMKD